MSPQFPKGTIPEIRFFVVFFFGGGEILYSESVLGCGGYKFQRVQAKVTHSQGWSKDRPFPLPHGSHRGRENFSRSGGQVLGEARRKRKRGDQAKLAPRRGFHPLPHRPPGKHKQLEAL